MRKISLSCLIGLFILTFFLNGCSTYSRHSPQNNQFQKAGQTQSTNDLDAIFDPSKVWPQNISDLKTDPNVVYGTLDNGLRYILMKNAKPEQRVMMHLFVQAGSMDESNSERGLAHFLEHLEFCGSKHFPPGELVKYFQSIGMQFGADANAQTGFYSTVYDIDLPDENPDSLKKGLLVFRDFASGALIPESEVNRERSVVLAEKRARDSAGYRTFEKSFDFELPDALLAKRLPIGVKSVIENADRKTLKSFYDVWYRPDKMILVLVGDFDPKTASEMIREEFSGITPRTPIRPYNDPGTIDHHGLQTFYHYEPEEGNTSVTIEVITKKINPPDTIKSEREDLISDMANSIINNRLSEMLDDPKTPFTGANIGSGNYLQYIQSAEINADCQPGKWKATLSAIEKTLRKALLYGFTQSEINIVKKDYIAQLDKAVKTASTRESSYIAHQIIADLSTRQVFQSPEQRQTLLAPMIMAINEKDLHDALVKDWSPDHRLVLVTGNLDLNNQKISPKKQIADVYNSSFAQPVEKPVEKSVIPFPYLSTPTHPGKILSRKDISDLGIVQVEFENGVRLNLKKTDFKANQVIASVIFGNGRSSEPEKKPGLAQLTQKVINLSGLGHLTRDELQKALAGKTTDVSFRVDEDDFVLSGQSITGEIPLLFQLFQAYLQDPGFREDAYTLAMQQFDQQYESLKHSIEGGMALKGAAFLAGGDSRFGLPEYDKFKANALDDVRKWVGPAFAHEPLEISIVGDLDVQSVIDLAATYFGSLSERNKELMPPELRLPKFPAGGTLNVTVTTEIPKGLVDVAYLTGDYWNIHRNRRLSVLSEVFSDRMRIRIRDKMGAAYSPYAYNRPSRAYSGYGMLQAVTLTDPAKTAAVVEAIKSISDDIVKNGVNSDELERALKPILEQIKELVKTNSYWLNNVMTESSRHPEQLEWSYTFLSDYSSITKNDLNNLARKYLNNQKAATIVIVPDKSSGD